VCHRLFLHTIEVDREVGKGVEAVPALYRQLPQHVRHVPLRREGQNNRIIEGHSAISGYRNSCRVCPTIFTTLIVERGRRMISVMIKFAVFFLFLFFLLPTVLIFLLIVRELILQARRQMRWNKVASEGLAG
jgi:hypothetical protein